MGTTVPTNKFKGGTYPYFSLVFKYVTKRFVKWLPFAYMAANMNISYGNTCLLLSTFFCFFYFIFSKKTKVQGKVPNVIKLYNIYVVRDPMYIFWGGFGIIRISLLSKKRCKKYKL